MSRVIRLYVYVCIGFGSSSKLCHVDNIDNIDLSKSQISGHIRKYIGKLLDCTPNWTRDVAISISNFRQTLSYSWWTQSLLSINQKRR